MLSAQVSQLAASRDYGEGALIAPSTALRITATGEERALSRSESVTSKLSRRRAQPGRPATALRTSHVSLRD